MTRYLKHRFVLLGLTLSILFLLCGCQSGVEPLILPPDIPAKDTSQGKAQLLAAMNQEYSDRLHISGHYIQGSDAAAETVLLYLQQSSGGDASKAVALLSENTSDEYGRANCADAVLSRLSPLPDETYWVSYAFLSDDMLDDGLLREDADFHPTARSLIDNKELLVLADSYSPSGCQKASFAVGVIGGKALVISVFVS